MQNSEPSGSSNKKVLNSVLIISVRNFRAQASNCTLYEFEDFIAQLCDTRIICPEDEKSAHRKVYRLAKYLTNSDLIADRLARFPSTTNLDESYDIVLVVADNPWQLHLLNQVTGWQEHSAKKVCYLTEFWPSELTRWRLKKEPFKNFDHIFVGLSGGISGLQDQVDRPCSFLPLGVDTDVFSPKSLTSERCIDINYIGRRLPDLHNALINEPRIGDYFYYFDTAKNQKMFVDNSAEHRFMYAQLLKRSVFSFAFPAKSNISSITGGIEEIGGRYYEFAAAGIIIIGNAPHNPHYENYFGWKDAVVSLPSNMQNTLSFLADLQSDKTWLTKTSSRNVVNSLRRNDWAYRWLNIIETLGYSPNQKLKNKLTTLANRANSLTEKAQLI